MAKSAALAFANNDVITIAWTHGKKLPGCMGYAIYRIDKNGKKEALPAKATFKGHPWKKGQTCEDAPYQKFYWKDVYARLIKEHSKGDLDTFSYRIVALEGKPGKLKPMNVEELATNKVTIGAEVSPKMKAYFNRGLISTQRISRALDGKPAKGKLLARVADVKDDLRASLSGDMVEALTEFMRRTGTDGHIYAALYELNDEELEGLLMHLGDRLHIVLSNPSSDDKETGGMADGNKVSRGRLKRGGADMYDRLLKKGQIGNNKFLVHVDKNGKAQAVLCGSTNWTFTGLCTQTNNTVVIDNPQVAERYLTYWEELKKDTKAAKKDATKLQAKALRDLNAKSKTIDLGKDGTWTSWFSPNTPKLRASNTKNEKTPPDMQEVQKLMHEAKEAVLMLAFYPGSPCLTNWAADVQKSKPDVFVRGCVTHISAAEGFYYQLHGMTPPKLTKEEKDKGVKKVYKQDGRVFAARALDEKTVPEGWIEEILSAGFAVIHDKIVVIDPFSDDCVVIMGSHNLGHRASYNNDENLAIIRGNRKLAEAYASHVLDVYDHFAWRYRLSQGKVDPNAGYLKTDPNAWQDVYFDADGKIKVAQLRFWLNAAKG